MKSHHTFNISLIFSILFIPYLMFGQSKTERIMGKITSNNKTPIVEASIFVEGNEFRTEIQSSPEGLFNVWVPNFQVYKLLIKHTGYESQEITIDMNYGNPGLINIILQEKLLQINEVNVFGKSETIKAKDQIIKAQIIDTKSGQQQASTLVEIMNRSAGIRIRQSGGLGSNTNITLNGFQGKSIKTFKDGIPTDYLGASFNLSNLPITMLEHVEIYKGVLPTHLSTDALGGAINLVSKSENNSYLAASYELASFNTHRAALNICHHSKANQLYAGVDAFFNYSDNNYRITASIPDLETANVIPKKISLFHNAYKQRYTEFYAGNKNLKWADEFRVGLTLYTIDRQNQYASSMERPYGASHGTQRANLIPTVRYKRNLLDGKLSIEQFLVYSKITNKIIDTLSGSYDWYGKFYPAIDDAKRGEAGTASLPTLKYSNFTSRTGIRYIFLPSHSLSLNIVSNDYNRKGSDPYGAVSAGEKPIDLLSLPADYTKIIGTIGINSDFYHEKLQYLAQFKYFYAKAVGREVNTSTGRLNEHLSTSKRTTFGVAEGIKWTLSKSIFFRLSAEYAARLPEQTEIMGDSYYALANFDLKPERSINSNLGLSYNRNSHFGLEINSFYRVTRDLIINLPVNLIYSQSSNVEQIRGIGLETDLFVEPLKWLRLNGNFTYQDFRIYHVTEPSIVYLENARLRNTPYFFSNFGANLKFDKCFSKTDLIHAYWYFSYVHEYYLNYIPKDTEPNGFLNLWGKAKVDAPNIIPKQKIHTFGVVWKPFLPKNLSINLECKNLFDEEVFDNFRIQNTGRSYHLKLNYLYK